MEEIVSKKKVEPNIFLPCVEFPRKSFKNSKTKQLFSFFSFDF